jgi:hypothetical protein
LPSTASPWIFFGILVTVSAIAVVGIVVVGSPDVMALSVEVVNVDVDRTARGVDFSIVSMLLARLY